MENQAEKKFRRKLSGVVTSDKGEKTIVVKVETRFKHPKYSKYVTKSKKYHAHDEKNEAATGSMVTIIESKPYSKLKRWELFSVKN